jgi:hypothetical protein
MGSIAEALATSSISRSSAAIRTNWEDMISRLAADFIDRSGIVTTADESPRP